MLRHALWFTCLLLASSLNAQGLAIRETTDTITVTRNEKTVLVYRKVSPPVPSGIDPVYQRSGFIHPLFSPSQHIVTAAFPADHAHQQGVFQAWVDTTYGGQNLDFWNLAKKQGTVVHDKVISLQQAQDSVQFAVTLKHRAVAEPVVDILSENWLVTVHDRGDDLFCIDIETTQTALTDVPLIVNQYHYGGMAFRGPVPWLAPNDGFAKSQSAIKLSPFTMRNDQTPDRIAGNHLPAKWVGVTGDIDGQTTSLVMLSHADNFRAPQPARLHPSKPYFCFSPCVNQSFSIEQNQPFFSRYRLLITSAAFDDEWANQQWITWCQSER